jgi:hypothetical protein
MISNHKEFKSTVTLMFLDFFVFFLFLLSLVSRVLLNIVDFRISRVSRVSVIWVFLTLFLGFEWTYHPFLELQTQWCCQNALQVFRL